MPANTLGDHLWDEISPAAVRPPSNGDDDYLILGYAASKLQEYQLGQRVIQPTCTRFKVVVAISQDNAKETEWTLLRGPDLSERDKAECEARIRRRNNGLHNPRVISARLLSYIDDIYPILRHIQNVLMKHESEGGGHQLQVDRATKKLIACIPETSRLRIQLSNDARAIAFNTFRNLVVLWGTYEQALEQLQPKYCHRPPTFDNEPTFRRTVNECTNLSEVQELLGTFASTDNSAKIKLSMSTRPSGCGRSQELHIHSVELTEHAATLQADDIYWWMRLTVKIMQYAQWLTDKDFAFGLYGKVCLGHLLELINFTRSGKEFYLRRLKELERMEKVARTGKVTTVEELGRIEEKPAPLHELARIDQIEGLEEDLARTEEKHAPIPWSPE